MFTTDKVQCKENQSVNICKSRIQTTNPDSGPVCPGRNNLMRIFLQNSEQKMTRLSELSEIPLMPSIKHTEHPGRKAFWAILIKI